MNHPHPTQMRRRKNDFLPTFFLAVSTCAASLVFLAIPAEAQNSVTIPARSSSSLDQQPGESDESNPPVPRIPDSSPFSRNSTVSRINVPVPETEPGEEGAPASPNVTSETAAGADDEEADPSERDFDINVIRRQAKLRQELRVANAATQARISLPADDLFDRDAPTRLDRLSTPTLQKVIEFIEMDEKKNVTIQGFYAPGRTEGKKLAWDRTLAVMEWMAANSNLEPRRFKAAAPRVVTRPTPKRNTNEVNATEFVDRIDLVLER